MSAYTLSTISEVIGLKENSNRKIGTVYVRSIGSNQHGETVLAYVRWVMVRKHTSFAPPGVVGGTVTRRPNGKSSCREGLM